jgi:hypothetical protein
VFVFGSSYGILALRKPDFRLSWLKSDLYPRRENPTDVFALEFLAENHNILLSGGRKGILNIADLRVPNTSLEDVIHHPSSITHIRQLDSHRIIVAGLNSNLCQYDLRFRRLTETVPSTARRRKKSIYNQPTPPTRMGPKRSIYNQTITRSILQYPDFQNDSTINKGFDVDLETGTVAAAQESDDFNPDVRLFSLHGGHTGKRQCLLKPLKTSERPLTSRPSTVAPLQMPRDFKVKNHVRCLKFFRDIEGRMKSLYVGSDDIQRFAWAGMEEAGP